MNFLINSDFLAQWLQNGAIVVILCVLYWLVLRAIDRLLLRFQYSQDLIPKSFIRNGPFIKLLCHLILLGLISQFTIGDLKLYTPFYTKDIIQVSIICLLTVASFVFFGTLEEHLILQQSSKFDVTAVQTFAKIARLGIVIVCVLILLPIFGIETSGILTLGAASSLVVGFASRDWLSNFFGGLMIFVDKPFGVGDWIKCSEKGIEGFVVSIGWRLTCIRTFERRPLYVPNSFFAQTPIENPSRMENRRIKHFIHLPYEDSEKIPLILDSIRDMLKQAIEIDQTKPIYVHVTQLGNSSVECMVCCFTVYTDWERFLQAQQKVMLSILKIIKENESAYGIPLSKVIIEHIES